MNAKFSTALQFENLHVSLHSREILHGISGELVRGAVTGILGPNGCGKTTLLRSLCRLLKPDAGKVFILDENKKTDIAALSPKALAQRISFLPQQRAVPDITVRALVAHGRYPYLGFSRTLTEKDEEIVQNALLTTGTAAFSDRHLASLSGGERQRVFLAMLLAQDTDVLLLDEPSAYLDARHRFEMMELLQTLSRQNKAIGVVLHELPLAFQYCDRLLVLENGAAKISGTPEEILQTDKIRQVFGVSLTRVDINGQANYAEQKING